MSLPGNYPPITAHFAFDEARTVRWMSHDRNFESTWSEFGVALGYEDKGDSIASGWRVHDASGYSNNRKFLKPITFPTGIPGKTTHLIRPFEILHRVFRENVAV